MKTLVAAISILSSGALFVLAAERPRPTRVPPAGIQIAATDRAELQSGAEVLGREIASLRKGLVRKPDLLALLPDVEIFHKAVEWPLRYDEIYRSNEVGLARSLLNQGTERARQLREGQAPWLTATGLVVRGYRSKIDGSVQPYGLVVPSGFASDRKRLRRLDVWLHGRDNNLTELKFIADRQRSYGEFAPPDAIVLHPYGRYCNAFKFAGEVDVFEAMEHAKRSYPIDSGRVALRGFSMGGAGVWHLAAHYPDVWAVAAPGAGFAETAEYQKLGTNRMKFPWWEQRLWQLYDATDYAANFFNLPLVAYNGTDDPQRQAADVMERAMKKEGLTLSRVWGTNVGHKYTPEAKKEISHFVDEADAPGKRPFPKEIRLTTRSLRCNRSCGITIVRMEQHWQRADVRLTISSSGPIRVLTTNIAELWLDLPAEGINANQIEIDGKLVPEARAFSSSGMVSVPRLLKDAEGRWRQLLTQGRNAILEKRTGLQGPIDDAFMDSFLIVRPSRKALTKNLDAWISNRLSETTNNWRAQFRGDPQIKDDTQITDTDIQANNLILFGDPQSNRLIERIVGNLPVQWDHRILRVGGSKFSAISHLPVLIFPNPLNPQRYVVLNSGFTFAAAGLGSNAQQTPKLPDYAVINIEDSRVELADFFDEQWQLK